VRSMQSSGNHISADLSCVCTPEPLDRFQNPALVVGHPGHELRVFGWMSEYKPHVYAITDGSGRHGLSRIPSTYRLVSRIGATPGAIFGAVSDAEIYRAILHTKTDFFLKLVSDLAASFVLHRIDFVAGDAEEGYNPTHDLCRVMVNAAADIAARSMGKPIANYEFCLAEWEQEFPVEHGERCIHLQLSDDLLQRKLIAADQYVEIQAEVRQGVRQRGVDYFRVECLKKVTTHALPRDRSEKPFYECFGEGRVAEGEYATVIRFKDHILPIMDAVLNFVARDHAPHVHPNMQSRIHGT